MVSLCLETILDGEKQSRINYEPKWPIDMNGKKHCDFNANLENEEKKTESKNLKRKFINKINWSKWPSSFDLKNKRREEKKEKIKVIAIRINGSWQARILDFFFLVGSHETQWLKKTFICQFQWWKKSKQQQQQQPSCLSDDDDDEHLTWKPYVSWTKKIKKNSTITWWWDNQRWKTKKKKIFFSIQIIAFAKYNWFFFCFSLKIKIQITGFIVAKKKLLPH